MDNLSSSNKRMYSHRQLRGRRLALGAERAEHGLCRADLASLKEPFGGQVGMRGPSAVHFQVDYPLLAVYARWFCGAI